MALSYHNMFYDYCALFLRAPTWGPIFGPFHMICFATTNKCPSCNPFVRRWSQHLLKAPRFRSWWWWRWWKIRHFVDLVSFLFSTVVEGKNMYIHIFSTKLAHSHAFSLGGWSTPTKQIGCAGRNSGFFASFSFLMVMPWMTRRTIERSYDALTF